MDNSQVYVLISLVAVALILTTLVLMRKNMGKPLSKIAAIAFSLVIAGVTLGEDRLIGYSLMGAGIAVAIVDIIKKKRK